MRIAYILPVRPSASPGPSGLRSSSSPEVCTPQVAPLVHFDATLASSLFARCLVAYSSRRLVKLRYQAPCSSSRPFSISGSRGPSFHFQKKRRENVACSLEVPPPGFGYPLGGVSSPDPWKPLSAPNALGLRPSELSSNPVAQNRSPYPVPLLCFSIKLAQLDPGTPAAYSSPGQPYPLSPPKD
jgi:hypothetical protein